MKIEDMAERLDIRWCGGGCGLSETRHREGCIFLGVVHFRERRFTKRAARNFLMLAARMQRESDEGYLNIPLFDWWYCYSDSIAAGRMAMECGFRLPAAVFDEQREMCRLLAAKRGVRLSKYRKVWAWSRP
jgi:hypothetical protein